MSPCQIPKLLRNPMIVVIDGNILRVRKAHTNLLLYPLVNLREMDVILRSGCNLTTSRERCSDL